MRHTWYVDAHFAAAAPPDVGGQRREPRVLVDGLVGEEDRLGDAAANEPLKTTATANSASGLGGSGGDVKGGQPSLLAVTTTMRAK